MVGVSCQYEATTAMPALRRRRVRR